MKILLVEDDVALASRLALALGAAGFAIHEVRDGVEALHAGRQHQFDAAILDLGLPALDGLTVLDRLRREGHRLPVLVLTARERWSDKLAAFNAGADDYVIKPFEFDEVVVRLKALIRRSRGDAHPEFAIGPLRLDTRDGRVSVHGEAIALTAQEHRILAYLVHKRGSVVSRTEIFEHVYAPDEDRDSNVIDVLVARIRRKLGAPLIHTVRGAGYRLAWEADA
ncbi:MAG: response regulator transcription factor [Steroidobacteraceae bacterium]|jgi:two-component system OmpR family response regulator|nr:response regulator transcription factor [Steroidobacteraceae bacterium]